MKMNKENWENLATAIVIQAADDYREALQTLKLYRTGEKLEDAKSMVASCEVFFKSDHAALLSQVDPIAIMEHIQREVACEC